jgi:TolB protein
VLVEGYTDEYHIFRTEASGATATQLTSASRERPNSGSWSPDGTRVVYDLSNQIWVMNADGSEKQQLTTDEPGNSGWPCWSPDGTHIAYSSSRDGNTEVYIMAADGTAQRRLTDNPAEDDYPSWSPDGTRLAFTSDRDGNLEIYSMSPTGTNVTRLTTAPATDMLPVWSPSGERLLFRSYRDGSAAVYTMAADGTGPALVSGGTSYDATWSPDGTRVLIPTAGFATMRPDGSDRVPFALIGAGVYPGRPAWAGPHRKIGNAAVSASVSRPWVIRNRGGALLSVSSIVSSSPRFQVQPGTFSLAPGDTQVVAVTFSPRAAGTHYATLTINSNDASDPAVRLVVNGTASGPSDSLRVRLPGGATMDFIWIDPGTFTMGDADYGPAHQVTLTKGYYLARTELTQRQWQSVMGTAPWAGQEYVQQSANNPAVHITLNDVEALVHALNQTAGDSLYRLPTEAEWEYACRAGTTTAWSFGDDPGQLGQYAWFSDNTWAVGLTWAQPVATRRPNPWGFYDMHGNVYEWVADAFGGYSSAPETDPYFPAASWSTGRVIRGGAVVHDATYARSAFHEVNYLAGFDNHATGARLLLLAAPPPNRPPRSDAGPDQAVAFGAFVNLTGAASSDADGDSLRFRWTAPAGITLSDSTAVQPTFSATAPGLSPFALTVDDGMAESAPDTVWVTVQLPDLDVLSLGTRSVTIGDTLALTIGVSGVAGESLTFSALDLPPGAVLSDSLFVWAPTFGQGGSYLVVLSVSDSHGRSDSDSLAIVVTDTSGAQNVRMTDQWITIYGTVLMEEGGPAPVGSVVDVVDAAGNTAGWYRVAAPGQYGFLSVYLDDPETIADEGAVVGEALRIRVNGIPTRSSVQWTEFGDVVKVDIIARPVADNRPPVLALIGSQTVAEVDSLTLVLAATDADRDRVSYSVSGSPAGASLVGSVFGWRPTYDQAGSWVLTFAADDSLGGHDEEQVTVTVTPTNRPPVLASLGTRAVAEWDTLTVVLSATDPDGDRLTFTAGAGAPGAVVQDSVFSWVPDYGQVGSHSVTITVSDGHGGSDSQAMAVSVSSNLRQVQLQLVAGFNLVSWPVDTRNDSVQAITTPIAADLVQVQGFETAALHVNGGASGAKLYTPTGGSFNTLRVTDHRLGYWLKMRAPRTLAITGRPVDSTTPLPLASGFNLVSYLANSVDSTQHAVASTASGLLQVQGFETIRTSRNLPMVGAKLYLPAGGSFNTLRIMSPLLGYWIKVAEVGMLTYPAVPAPGTPSARWVAADAPVMPTDQWVAVYGQVVNAEGRQAPAGTVVDVVDGEGHCAGWFTVQTPGSYGYLPVYLDDPETAVDEGAAVGEWLQMRVDGVATGVRVQWTEFGDVVNRDLVTAAPNATQSHPTPVASALHGARPNPFNPATVICYDLARPGHVRLQVYAVNGQLVRDLVAAYQEAGSYQVPWDGRDAAGVLVGNGVYLGVMQAGPFRAVARMVLMK